MERLTDYEELKNRLIEMITKGIEEEPGVFRKMDEMDYYSITDIPPKKLYERLKESVQMTPHERRVIVDYAAKCSVKAFALPKEKLVERVMKEKVIIKGIEITPELKEEAINFLEENNIPFAYANYIAYVRRVVNQMAASMERD